MNNKPTLFFFLAFLLPECTGSSTTSIKTGPGDTLLETSVLIKDNQVSKQDSTSLYTGWYYIVDTANRFERQLDKSSQTFFINPNPIVTAKNFTTLEIYESSAAGHKYLGLTMRLDKKGTEQWSTATGISIGKQLAFILDNKLLHVATVMSQITAGVTALNRGNYTRQELEKFKGIIENEK